jgi:hypothetical protein
LLLPVLGIYTPPVAWAVGSWGKPVQWQPHKIRRGQDVDREYPGLGWVVMNVMLAVLTACARSLRKK